MTTPHDEFNLPNDWMFMIGIFGVQDAETAQRVARYFTTRPIILADQLPGGNPLPFPFKPPSSFTLAFPKPMWRSPDETTPILDGRGQQIHAPAGRLLDFWEVKGAFWRVYPGPSSPTLKPIWLKLGRLVE